jgi:hypothetical protein
MMANSGGAWDNAKKYSRRAPRRQRLRGAQGGSCGDTVGDRSKDTSGPSLYILIKLISMVSIVFARSSCRTPVQMRTFHDEKTAGAFGIRSKRTDRLRGNPGSFFYTFQEACGRARDDSPAYSVGTPSSARRLHIVYK